MSDVNVLAISGSLRTGSYNTALAHAAQKHAPGGISVSIYEGMRQLPLFDEDFDTETPPEPVADLRHRINVADGLLIVTPEYNGSVPGPLKNAIDWASRPAGGSSLQRKPIAIAGASPSNFGTVRAQLALRQMLIGLDAEVPSQPEVMVFRAHDRIDSAGNVTDEFSLSLLQDLLIALMRRIHARAERDV